jgi:hypothetical protein
MFESFEHRNLASTWKIAATISNHKRYGALPYIRLFKNVQTEKLRISFVFDDKSILFSENSEYEQSIYIEHENISKLISTLKRFSEFCNKYPLSYQPRKWWKPSENIHQISLSWELSQNRQPAPLLTAYTDRENTSVLVRFGHDKNLTPLPKFDDWVSQISFLSEELGMLSKEL